MHLPYHYRDSRTAQGVEAVHAVVDRDELYRRNGLQFLPFATVYQLAAEQRCGALEAADAALLIPDLLGYWLTGTAVTERTNASTTRTSSPRSSIPAPRSDRYCLRSPPRSASIPG
ncbi:carbohydrate kinase [Mycobacteroides abscessus subsp. abscessus]|nr:carbohydrate kinase [Mycobacteroides abscessus subsp. abscessus]